MTTVGNERTSGLVSPGFHYGRLVAVEEKAGPKGEYWQYTVKIEEQSPDNEREMPMRISLSPDSRWKVNEFLDAIGAPLEGQTESTTYLGSLIKVHCVESTWNGKPKMEIDSIFSTGIEDPNPAAAKAVKDGMAAALVSIPSPVLVDNKDDEIPF